MKLFDKRAASAAGITAAVWILMGISGIASAGGNAECSAREVLISVGEQLALEVSEMETEIAEDASDPYRDRPLEYLEGQQFDVRIIEPMEEMVKAARAEGLSVLLSSGYRSYATQTWLFNRKAAEYGETVAATIVARPGTSEHQTGLCCDITDHYYEMKDASLENTEMYQWMSRHCDEYGFIVRFPKGREDITGIIYEPWHFRYVGKEAAAYIMEHDLTLEEFLELYQQ